MNLIIVYSLKKNNVLHRIQKKKRPRIDLFEFKRRHMTPIVQDSPVNCVLRRKIVFQEI